MDVSLGLLMPIFFVMTLMTSDSLNRAPSSLHLWEEECCLYSLHLYLPCPGKTVFIYLDGF